MTLPSFVSDAATTMASGGTATVSAPSGTSPGMLVRAMILVYDTTTAAPTISGWNIYRTDSFANATAQATIRILWRILTGSDSYSVTIGSGDYSEVYIQAWNGAHATTPLVDTGAFTQGTGNTATATGVTVSTPDSIVFYDATYYNKLRATNPNSPGTWTARELDFDGGTLASLDSPAVSAGPTGNITGMTMTSVGGNEAWGITVGVIAPAVAGSAAPQLNNLFFGSM